MVMWAFRENKNTGVQVKYDMTWQTIFNIKQKKTKRELKARKAKGKLI